MGFFGWLFGAGGSVLASVLLVIIKYFAKKGMLSKQHVERIEHTLATGNVTVKLREKHLKQLENLRNNMYDKSPEDLKKEQENAKNSAPKG